MLQRRTYVVVVLALFAAASLQAVTYVVPSDRDLVRMADAIVIASAVESHPQRNELGGIETATTFRIDDQLKGGRSAELTVIEPGGSFDGHIMFIPGSPRFVNGTRYLLFLHRMPSGKLTVHGLGLGKFDFTSDIEGQALVSRGGDESAIGWNPDGSIYTERLRSAPQFLDFVRTVAKFPTAPVGENYFAPHSTGVSASLILRPAPNFVPSDYLFTDNNPPLRVPGGTASFGYCCSPTFQPSPLDGPAAAAGGVALWNGTGVIHYTISGTNTAMGGVTTPDDINTILFNDSRIDSTFGSGVVAVGGVLNAVGTHTFGGQTFFSSSELDVAVATNSNFNSAIGQAIFNAVLAHELGHTLGFRHADGSGTITSPPPNCAAPMPCSTGQQAIMEHLVGRTSLGQWDMDAANTVYGSGCNPPSISVQPQSTSITAGNSATLSVTASGTGDTYQWFTGAPGTGSPINGATGSSVQVNPSTTTTFHVRVTACGTTVNSSAATVTVSCLNPSITTQPQSQSITAGTTVNLTVGANGSSPTYQWFQGTPGSGTPTGQTTATITVGPPSTTSFYVVVTACGQTATSNVATITVAPCTSPSIVTHPQSTSILAGGTTTLTVAANGSNLTYQWFIGTSGNTGNPIAGATGPSLVVSPNTQTSYWVRVTASCNSNFANSNTATVSIGVACSTTLTSVTSSANPVLPGASFALTANATTTSGTLSYQWFSGALNDTSSGVLGASQTFTTSETATTNYWVKVTASCGGSPQTAQLTVNLNTGTCGTNPNQLCINGTRYRVTVTAKDTNGTTGQGVANYESDVFGYFTLPTFSTPSDPQIFVKVIATTPWVFYAGLTNLDYTITVVDTQTGQTFKTLHVLPPVQDPRSLAPEQSIGDYDVDGFNTHSGNKNVECAPVQISAAQTTATPGSCPNNGSSLCLLSRFTITLQAVVNNSSGASSAGATVPGNSQFGFFTTPAIAGPSDVQAFIKMIDAHTFDGHFWVFLGGLTDFQLTYTVTDTQTGKQKIYRKPPGSTCGWNDTSAFNF